MATNLNFNNISTQKPGAFSSVDASGLATVGLGSTGIVALIGSAQGGAPYTSINGPADFLRINNPSSALQAFSGGDLLEAIAMAFAPSSDSNLPGGAQQVIALKVNPSTPASAIFSNANGPVMQVTSLDYGSATTQINVSIAPGSQSGQMLTIGYQDILESADNLGGSLNFTLQYVPGGPDSTLKSYTAMAAGTEADGSIHANGSFTLAGLAQDITSTNGTPAVASVTYTSADAGQTLAIYGLDADGNALRENVLLGASGGTLQTQNSFATIMGAAFLYNPAYGTVQLSLRGSQVCLFNANQRGKGAVVMTNAYVANGLVTVQNPSNAQVTVIIDGLNAQGAPEAQAVVVQPNASAAAPVALTDIVAIAAGQTSSNVSLSFSAQAARFSSANASTLSQAKTYFNTLQTLSGGNAYGFLAEGDYTIAKVQLASLDATPQDLNILQPQAVTSGLNAIVNWINTNSQLVSAVVLPNAHGAPYNTSRPVYLGGGGEAPATFADYQNCLNLLKELYVNSVVCLTSDPAVSAAVNAHCTYMCGAGQKERDAFVGVMGPDLVQAATKKQALAQAEALNSRNIRAIPTFVSRYNQAGVLTEFAPHFAAVIAAGMQAAGSVGTSLTRKYAGVVSFRHDKSLDAVNNASDLIAGGLMFLEHIDGLGSRWCRNVTTYLQDNNLAFCEGSVNEAANYSVYTVRTALDTAIGRPAFAGTQAAVATLITGELTALVKQGVITGYQPAQIAIVGDTISVALTIAPIVPTNFITLTMHLSTQSAINSATSAT